MALTMTSHQNGDQGLLLSRAYQLEMFEASMRGNIIVTMDTGSGKTHVARLRIEAELQRTPGKRVWLLAPTVVLCRQQSVFLSSQLQAYNFRTLLGSDNVHLWRSRETWDAVLRDIDVVVSTPQVLLDALNSAFVSLEGVSLLVLDEAHNCNSDSPAAMIMRLHYHRLKSLKSQDLPHLLGLTASPIISNDPAEMERLELLLDASCRSPTRSIVEYRHHVHLPQLVAIECGGSDHTTSRLLALLEEINLNVKHTDDPYYRNLLTMSDSYSIHKLQKYPEKRTPAMQQIHQFATNAKYLSENLGPTACDDYIRSCVKIWHEAVAQHQDWLNLDARSDASFIDDVLFPLRCAVLHETKPAVPQITSKVAKLVNFLNSEPAEEVKIVIFVTRRTTALALSSLLNSLPSERSGHAFAFLGAATLHRKCLYEVTDVHAQDTAFADFRSGVRDICVATASLEEGIDVQAINIVVRFDAPATFKSYIQSRGRARKPGSKFVFFLDADNAVKRYSDWNVMEQQMKAQYTDEMRALRDRETLEAELESGEETYHVNSTNATLDYTSAVQRLNHFCASQRPPGYAIMMMEGEPGKCVTVTAVLPSSLPATLQKVQNKYPRRTEHMAKRDAAFQACVMLHKAGLMNDNLVPPYVDKTQVQDKVFENKQLTALTEIEVWETKSLSSISTMYLHRLEFDSRDFMLPGLLLILPSLVDHDLEFQLQTSHLGRVTVRLRFCGEYSSSDWAADLKNSKVLLRKVFGDKILTSNYVILLPDLPPESPRALTSCLNINTPIEEYVISENQSPLLFFSNRNENARPYHWIPTSETQLIDKNSSIPRVALIKSPHLQFHLADTPDQVSALPKQRRMAEIHAHSVATEYGCSVQLVPSVLHIVGSALRAQKARDTILRQIPFKDKSLFTQALITKSSSALFNYERLEFLGDAILKYLSSLQTFFDLPQHGSDALTAKVSEVVGNDYLQRSTQHLGLDAFISASSPSRTHWQFPYSMDSSFNKTSTHDHRLLSSKTLADVIESIVGASFLQGNNEQSRDRNALCALRVLLPEITWNFSEKSITDARNTAFQFLGTSLKTKPRRNITNMLGFEFKDAALVQQALTHTTDLIGVASYDRLEFLGDAILDRIIKVKLYHTTSYDPARMSLIRHAAVSHAMLAFVALSIFIEVTDMELEVETSCKVFAQSEKARIYLTQQISTQKTIRDQIAAARSRCETRRTTILEHLSSGKFPWTLLYSINAPKVCSDIIESLLAATYLDSGGSLEACEQVLNRLNVMKMIHLLSQNANFELKTPRVLLQEHTKEEIIIDVQYEKIGENEQSFQACLNIKGSDRLSIMGATCKEEAECLVAEKALSIINARTE